MQPITTSGEVISVTTNELRHLLVDTHQESALERHLHGVGAILAASPVRYYDIQAFMQKPEIVKSMQPHELLAQQAVKSVLFEYSMLDSTSAIKSEHDGDWKVGYHDDTVGESNMRFFVTKAIIGHLKTDSYEANMIERHTYAALSLDGKKPREIDVRHSMGIETRNERDTRDVVIAPTSRSVYARKLE